jgi:hypothetical protein
MHIQVAGSYKRRFHGMASQLYTCILRCVWERKKKKPSLYPYILCWIWCLNERGLFQDGRRKKRRTKESNNYIGYSSSFSLRFVLYNRYRFVCCVMLEIYIYSGGRWTVPAASNGCERDPMLMVETKQKML